jgi:hypothetical protein
MTEREAAAELEDAELIPVMHGRIPYIKEVIARCLEAEIPALGGCPPEAGKG